MPGTRFKTLLAATAAGLVVSSASALESANMVRQIRVESASGSTVVSVDATNPPTFTTFKQDHPRRVIVDLAATRLEGSNQEIDGDGRLVTRVMARQVVSGTSNILRVMVELAREAEYRVMVQGTTLKVLLHPGSGGMLASAGIPMDESPLGRENPGRDLALAEELSQPGPVEVSTPSDSVPTADEAPQPAGGSSSDEGPGATEPPPRPVGVASGQLQPPGGVAVPATDESAAEASAPPAAPRAVAGESMAGGGTMLAAVHPGSMPRASDDGGGRVVAQESTEQAESASEVEEVEEVEEVPAQVEEEVPQVPEAAEPASPPEQEEGLPPPPPAPLESDQQPAEAVPAPSEQVQPVPSDEVPPPPPADERVELAEELRKMTWVGFQQTQEASRVFVKTNAPVKYRVYEEGDRLVVLELENTVIPLRNNKRFLDTHFFDSAVTMITPRELKGVNSTVRIEIELRQKVPYQAVQEDNIVYLNFQRPR